MTVPPLPPSPGESPRPYGVEPYPVSQYSEYQGRRSYEPPPSKTTAVWALCLSFFGLLGLIAIGLAIGVLVSSRDGLDRGKGMAIAALVIAPLAITMSIVGGLVRLGVLDLDVDEADRDPSGTITQGQAISISAVHVGDCLDDQGLGSMLGGEESELREVSAVPCDEVHAVEAYHEFDVEGDDYPGDPEIRRLARDGCLAGFQAFVGIPFARSTLNISYFGPLEESWQQDDARAIVCVVIEADGSTTGTLEGSRL